MRFIRLSCCSALSVVVFFQSYAQLSRIDSLENEIKLTQDLVGKISLFNELSNYYQGVGDLRSALQTIDRSIKAVQRAGQERLLAEQYENKAKIYSSGDRQFSLDAYSKALSIYENLNDSSRIAATHYKIGYLIQEEPEGISHFERALEFYRSLGDSVQMALCHAGMAVTYWHQQDDSSASMRMAEALKIFPEDGNELALASMVNNIGYLYYEKGRFSEALEHFLEAFNLLADGPSTRVKAFAAANVGKAHLALGSVDPALEWGATAMNIAREEGDIWTIRYVSEFLDKVHIAHRDYSAAYESFRLYDKLDDSIRNEGIKNSILRKELENAYEKDLLAMEARESRREAVFRLIILSVSAGLILTLLFFMILRRRYSLIREQKEIISRQKGRMEQELEFGRSIQMSMMPSKFPAFPDDVKVDLHATLIPAHELGGDFYDFFLIDDNRLFFTVGDVSDKGVPSALMMAVAKTLISSAAHKYYKPGTIMTEVNDSLCKNNDKAMFITLFLGILDLRSGQTLYCNAGHNPPYIKMAKGSLQRLSALHGPVVGAMEGFNYEHSEFYLNPDDFFLIYTDGITEAKNENGELFGEQRVQQLLEGLGATDQAETFVETILDGVQAFEHQGNQSDDITLLVFRITGN